MSRIKKYANLTVVYQLLYVMRIAITKLETSFKTFYIMFFRYNCSPYHNISQSNISGSMRFINDSVWIVQKPLWNVKYGKRDILIPWYEIEI